MALALLLIGAEAAGPATTDELHRLEARFEERLSALQSQMDLLRQENAELRQGRGGARTAADEGGRRLSQEGRRLNPASQRIMWHNGMLHRFDVPNTCGLDADLHKSDEPLMIQRSRDGNLTMLYGSTGVAMQTTAPIEVTHPSGCASKTLTLDGDVEIVGTLKDNIGAEITGVRQKTLQADDWTDSGSDISLTADGSYHDFPNLLESVTLTYPATVLATYHIAWYRPAGATYNILNTQMQIKTDSGGWAEIRNARCTQGHSVGTDKAA